jgi:hypothetical protein
MNWYKKANFDHSIFFKEMELDSAINALQGYMSNENKESLMAELDERYGKYNREWNNLSAMKHLDKNYTLLPSGEFVKNELV